MHPRLLHFSQIALILLVLGAPRLRALAGETVFETDFEKAAVGAAPAGFTVVGGDFQVKESDGNKFLELPGAPLDSFGLLFGPPLESGASATGRFFATKEGRKYPAFGISVNGVSGYRLQASPAKKALEIYKGDESKASAAWTWTSGVWTRLKIEAIRAGDGWTIRGKAWPDGGVEPAEWNVSFDDPEKSSPGRAGIWGSPFSGTPIRYDDLKVEKAP